LHTAKHLDYDANPGEQDYGEVEPVPAMVEVQLAVGHQLQDGFDCEDGHKEVVDSLEDVDDRLVYVHPVESQSYGVAEYVPKDEPLKVLPLHYIHTEVPQLVVSAHSLLERSAVQGEDLSINPLLLTLRDHVDLLHVVLLLVERIDHDLHEQVESEEEAKRGEGAEYQSHVVVVVYLRLVVY
jgi:hypothetical protein